MTDDSLIEKNAFGGAEGMEGIRKKLAKKKPWKLFSTYDDAKKEANSNPRPWGKW